MKLKCNYIVHEREDYNRGIMVYKIGLSGNMFKRMAAYPKGSKLVFMSLSPHMELVEAKLIQVFSVFFKQRLDRGREYFEGKLSVMMKIMMETITYYNDTVVIETPIDNSLAKNEAIITIRKYVTNYLICKRNKKMFFTIKNFIKDSKIVKNKNSFLKVKDVKLLWNTRNNTNQSENEIINLLSPMFGDVIILNGSLGWKKRAFDNTTIIQVESDKYDKNEDKYKSFRDLYIVQSDNSFIQWSDLRNLVDKWLKKEKKQSLDGRGHKDLKKYFEKKLGKFTNTTRNNVHVHGFINWSLISNDIIN